MSIADDLLKKSEEGGSIRDLVCERFISYTRTKDGEVFQFSDGSTLALIKVVDERSNVKPDKLLNLDLH